MSISRDTSGGPVIETIAHRGTPREHPENSLAGFLHAIALGADGIELDVHLTADDVIVVHHDPAIPRPISRGTPPPPLRQMTYADVRGYPLADGTPVPTLLDVLRAVDGRAVVYIEAKAPNMADAVVQCLTEAGARRWSAVHSFDHRIAQRVNALDATIPTGILLDSYLVDPATALRSAGARDYWQWWELIDKPLVRAVHTAGGRVVAWTVNEVMDAQRLRDIGVDALCTDVCGVFRAV